MAEIKPLRAWRYNESLGKNIETLTAPLFDVVSDKQRKLLYKHPHNSIHLSVPETKNPAQHAAYLLDAWKHEGIINQDVTPGIYVYYQYFKIAGSSKEFCRKGFICNIRLYDWIENIIQRHENTIPKSVNDRIELLEKTQLNVSPTHGLYTDPKFKLEQYMDEAIAQPLYETEDYQGARDVFSVITNPPLIEKFTALIRHKKIILADGHHRYEASLAHRQNQQRKNPDHSGNEGYNFHLMYLTNTEADDLRILPTHRLLKNLADYNEALFLKKLEDDFVVKPVEEVNTLYEVIVGKKWTFGVITKNKAFKIQLKPSAFPTLPWPFPDIIKKLDLTLLHYFIIEKIFNIPGKAQRNSENITFERSFTDCVSRVMQRDAQVAIITNEISIEEVKSVCASGYTMPQKSTYFYPKVICGFLFSSIKESEFTAAT
jgi:uncharacterized protein (DUF1015 family)